MAGGARAAGYAALALRSRPSYGHGGAPGVD